MILNIIFATLLILGMVLVLRDNDAEIVAWREGKYGKAILLGFLYMLRIAFFFFFAPIAIMLMIMRK